MSNQGRKNRTFFLRKVKKLQCLATVDTLAKVAIFCLRKGIHWREFHLLHRGVFLMAIAAIWRKTWSPSQNIQGKGRQFSCVLRSNLYFRITILWLASSISFWRELLQIFLWQLV